jgi:ketosteroid isomerase-like protein
MSEPQSVAEANLALQREAMEVASREGSAALGPYLADDVVWYEIGRAEPVLGREALIAHLSRDTGWHIVPFIHDVIAGEDHVVVLIRSHASRAGHTLNYRVAEIYHVRDGKVTARWAFSDDTEAIARFFA